MNELRELLVLAANAAGIELEPCTCYKDFFKAKTNKQHKTHWSPITDDGDCARLEAALGIDIEWRDEVVWAVNPDFLSKVDCQSYKDFNNDRQAARRMAVVKVAAEIGRAMG